MQHKKNKEVEWLEFDLLTEISRLKHGVFLRHGGQSIGPYASLNLGAYVGDSPEAFSKNVSITTDTFSLPNLVWTQQEHGKHISKITNPAQKEVPQGDVLTTSCPGVGLMITHADCQAAIFYDPIHHAVANVHAGWRGSVLNIYAETVAFMKDHYGSQLQDLLVCISPSLGPQDAQFVNFQTELPQSFWAFQPIPTYFDFWAISTMQLLECGILPHHIEIARISTFAHPEDYFSYRRDRITGRHGTVVALL